MTGARRAEITFGAGLLGFVIIFALIGEGILRLRAGLRYDWASFVGQIMYEDEEYGFQRFQPNTSFELVSINDLGLPGPDVVIPKPAGTLRLAFLGDSTFLAASLSTEERLPHVVTDLVAEAFPECTVDYISISGPSYAFTETRVILGDVQAQVQPDAYLIMLGGLKETMQAVEDRVSPEPPYFRTQRAGAQTSRLLTNVRNAYEALEASRAEEEPDLVERLDVEVFRAVFAESLDGLAALIGSAPTVVIENRGRERDSMDADALALLRRALLSNFDGLGGPGLIQLRSLMRGVTGATAEANGWAYIDPLSDIAPTNRHFDGALHFTAEGVRAVAPAVAEAMIAEIKATNPGHSCAQ